jgi:hypothetical protein
MLRTFLASAMIFATHLAVHRRVRAECIEGPFLRILIAFDEAEEVRGAIAVA